MRRAVKRDLELLADRSPVQRGKAIDHGDRAGLVFHDEAGEAGVDDLRDRAAVIGDHGRAAGHRFDHHEAERLRPVDRDQQADRAGQEIGFLAVADLADIFDQRVGLDERGDQLIVIVLVGAIDLGRDLERNAASCGNPDGAIHALFRRDPPEHGEIGRLHRLRRQQILRQSVVNGAHPVGLRHRAPLRIGDRDHRNLGEGVEYRLMLRQVEPAMQGGQERRRLPVEQREWIVVEMKVQKIELFIVAFLPHALQHHHMQCIGIPHRAVEAQRFRPRCVEFRRGA